MEYQHWNPPIGGQGEDRGNHIIICCVLSLTNSLIHFGLLLCRGILDDTIHLLHIKILIYLQLKSEQDSLYNVETILIFLSFSTEAGHSGLVCTKIQTFLKFKYYPETGPRLLTRFCVSVRGELFR